MVSRPGSMFRAYRPPVAVRLRRLRRVLVAARRRRPTGWRPGRRICHGRGIPPGTGRRLRLPRRPSAADVAAASVAWQRSGVSVRRTAGVLPGLERLSGPSLPAAPLEAQRLRDAAPLPATAAWPVPGWLYAVTHPAGAPPLPPVRRGDRGGLLARLAARPARVPKPPRRDTCVAEEDDPPDAVRPEGVHRPDRGFSSRGVGAAAPARPWSDP